MTSHRYTYVPSSKSNGIANIFEYLWVSSNFTQVEWTLSYSHEIFPLYLFQPWLGKWHHPPLSQVSPRLEWHSYLLSCHHPHQPELWTLFSEYIPRCSASHLLFKPPRSRSWTLQQPSHGFTAGPLALTISCLLESQSPFQTWICSQQSPDKNLSIAFHCIKKKKKDANLYHGLPGHMDLAPTYLFILIWCNSHLWPPCLSHHPSVPLTI